MNRFKLYLNDTNTENQKKCVKILFKHSSSFANGW